MDTDCGLWLNLDREVSPSWALARNSAILHKSDIPQHSLDSRILQTRVLPFKTAEVRKMKVCTAHDAHSSEVCEDKALLVIVSNFSAFLSEALLGLFCKHFFPHFSLSLISAESVESSKLRKSAEMSKIGSTAFYCHNVHIKGRATISFFFQPVRYNMCRLISYSICIWFQVIGQIWFSFKSNFLQKVTK